MNNSVSEFRRGDGIVRFRNIEEYLYCHMLVATASGIDPHMQRGRLAAQQGLQGDATPRSSRATAPHPGSGWHGPGAEAEQAFLEEDADVSDL